MIIGFDSFVNKVIKSSGEKCKNVVYATYNDYMVLLIVFIMFYTSFSVTMFYSKYAIVFIILYIFVMLYIYFMISTRKIGFGMSDSRFVYVKFKHIGFKEKEVYDIMFDNVKYLDVKKILGITYVKMSFIDGTGRFKKLKFTYAPRVVGMDASLQQKNGLAIYDKLISMQKVLDRGDF